MSGRVDLVRLAAREFLLGTWVCISPQERDALVEAVQAARDFQGDVAHSYRCAYRTAAKGWKHGDPPVIECGCGLDRLAAALAVFGDESPQEPFEAQSANSADVRGGGQR